METQVSRRLFLAATGSALCSRAAVLPAVSIIRTPGGGLQPQAIVDRKGVVHAVYLYGDPAASDVAYICKQPDEAEFSPPVRVNDRQGSAIALGTVRGVHLALGAGDRVHVAWNGSSTAGPRGPRDTVPMLYARLDETAKAFEPQRNIVQSASGLDGGGVVAADREGNVYIAWHAPEQQNGQAAQGEAHRRVWVAHSSDNGRSFSPETAVSPAALGACGCCGMGALADAHGNLYLLFRTAHETVHRDMCLLVSGDRGHTFRAADLHRWEIGACPMSTVSLAESDGSVFVAWETQGQVFFAPVNGKNLEPGRIVQASGSGKNRKHPSIAVNGRDEVLLSWTEGTGWKKGGFVCWQKFDSAFAPAAGENNALSIPAWGFASVISTGDRFLMLC